MKRCGFCVGIQPGEARTGVPVGRSGKCPCCGQYATALFEGDCTAVHPGLGRPPLVLVETGNPDGLDDPVVTKEDGVALVSITWDQPMEPELVAEAIRTLHRYRGEHPRIDTALERLERLGGTP